LGWDGRLEGAFGETHARDKREMRVDRDLTVVQGGHFRALESDRLSDSKSVQLAAPDEPQDSYSMAPKQVSDFVHLL
jgi:hypothetical protein